MIGTAHEKLCPLELVEKVFISEMLFPRNCDLAKRAQIRARQLKQRSTTRAKASVKNQIPNAPRYRVKPNRS